jgi:hypothetical protein
MYLDHFTTKAKLSLVLFAAVLVTGCTAGPNTLIDVPGPGGSVAGFWLGVWHGVIAPITFLVSLFSKDVSFYEVHNNGGWYNFGFVLGAGILLGGGRRAKRRRY